MQEVKRREYCEDVEIACIQGIEFSEDPARHDRCMQLQKFYSNMRRVEGAVDSCSYRDDTGTIASSSSTTQSGATSWRPRRRGQRGARSLAVCRLLTAATS